MTGSFDGVTRGDAGRLQTRSGASFDFSSTLENYETEINTGLAAAERERIAARIWKKDHTVWSPDPREISDRLAWLDLPRTMAGETDSISSFADEIRASGFKHVVVLGMGGSSLSSVTFREVFGHKTGFPELIVLDSTVPESIRSVTDSVKVARTLFLVSSKSGTTVEPLLLYRYFRRLVEESGVASPGSNFVAITDPGTPLVRFGQENAFRRTFFSNPEVGGRYSVLSHFGLVPAALSGVDVAGIVERSRVMSDACRSSAMNGENSGAWLGVLLGTLARRGVDKLTVITSPGLASMGVWIEQLVAESTGKGGKGIIPVVGEPVLRVGSYGRDRLFVYIRLDGVDNRRNDALISRLRRRGHAIVVHRLLDGLSVGAEFFRWEFATAVAGAVLGLNPFDQPDVQSAKTAMTRILLDYRPSARLPIDGPSDTLVELLASAPPRGYLALMAYVRETPQVRKAFDSLRKAVSERFGIATTLGFGPRFLHSTGQLHKGGPQSGVFYQITSDHSEDVTIPGRPYSFGFQVNAQASGDLEALKNAGRRVAWIKLGSGNARDIKSLSPFHRS